MALKAQSPRTTARKTPSQDTRAGQSRLGWATRMPQAAEGARLRGARRVAPRRLRVARSVQRVARNVRRSRCLEPVLEKQRERKYTPTFLNYVSSETAGRGDQQHSAAQANAGSVDIPTSNKVQHCEPAIWDAQSDARNRKAPETQTHAARAIMGTLRCTQLLNVPTATRKPAKTITPGDAPRPNGSPRCARLYNIPPSIRAERRNRNVTQGPTPRMSEALHHRAPRSGRQRTSASTRGHDDDTSYAHTLT